MLCRRLAGMVVLLLSLRCVAAPPRAATEPAPSGVYSEIVEAYMGGQWDALEAALRDKTREITALSGQQAADIREIRTALGECRPAWWKQVKAGKKIAFHPSLWGRSFPATYDPALKSSMQVNFTNGVPSLTVNWPADEMDNPEIAEHGFSKGDLTDLGLCTTLGALESWVSVPPATAPLDESGKLALGRYLDFRGNATGLVYANPQGRHWAVFLFLLSYTKTTEKSPARMGREALGAMIIQEVLTHPEVYKSFQLPRTLAAENAEQVLGAGLSGYLEKHGWTLAEDLALRNAAKPFAVANGLKTYTSGLVILPNKLPLALSPEADAPLRPKRDAWVKQQFDKLAKLNP